MAKQNPLKKFPAEKIGTGRLFRSGSMNTAHRHRRGLAGALRKFNVSGRHSYAKNLSQQDLKTFHRLIGDEMSKLTTHSKGPGYRARRRIMQKAEALRKAGDLSRADKADLKNILAAISPGAGGGAEKIAPAEPRQRAVKFGGTKRISGAEIEEESHMSPETLQRIPTNTIESSNLRRQIDEVEKNKIEPNDENNLGQFEDDQYQAPRRENEDDENDEVQLPDMSKVKDLDIG